MNHHVYLKSLKATKITRPQHNYANGNLGPGLRQAQTYGRVEHANGIISLPLLVIRSPKVKITT